MLMSYPKLIGNYYRVTLKANPFLRAKLMFRRIDGLLAYLRTHYERLLLVNCANIGQDAINHRAMGFYQ